MATEVLLPNGNSSWSEWNPYDYTRVDGSCSTASYCSTSSGSDGYVIYNMGNVVASPTTITSIAVRTYARERFASTGQTIISIYIKGAWVTSFGDSQGTSWAYDTSTFNGSWTKAEVDAMLVRVQSDNVSATIIDLACVQATITYTLPITAPVQNDPSDINCYDGTSRLSWGAVSGATGYRIYSAISSGGEYGEVTGSPTTNLYLDRTKTAAITLYYKIKAYNATELSDYSNYKYVSWKVPTTPLSLALVSCTNGVPTFSFTITAGQSATYINLYWDTTSGMTSSAYDQDSGISDGANSYELQEDLRDPDVHPLPLAAGTWYLYARSHNPVGFSLFTSVLTFTVPYWKNINDQDNIVEVNGVDVEDFSKFNDV